MYRKFFKRFLDIVISLVAIILTLLPLLALCIIVKIDSKGPAIFKSERIGQDGKIFHLYKLRTMATSAPSNMATRDLDGEKYITKIGVFLRKSSLDELPQFYNVLKGDMSIIGPRPACLCEDDLHKLRFKNGSYAVRPGITGLAQVNGRDILALDYIRKATLDAEYVKKISFWKDVKIFLKTFIVVFKAENVVEGSGVETVKPLEEMAQPYAENIAAAAEEVEEIVEEVAVDACEGNEV